ncbi:hypothetical protein P280DRAFT_474099 [Massarina eburnea CBS 473.64]|uniref:Uncharacterized protein n=1 Tax=Massarina eburnea CBS 473.64 TaxID=1395130 RepID=A0A6A6RI98_9PLEO|nr:hypothetical protein P280DRAFT_474099 [Massarina eburnea CBS 473.64]
MDAPVLSATRDELHPANSARYYSIMDIDDRLPYRQGWPLLPVLPVMTSHQNIPKVLSPSSENLGNMHDVLKKHNIVVHTLEVKHRHNIGIPPSKSTLTLCVLTDENENAKWAPAIRSLRTYVLTQLPYLTLAIEFIDHRIFSGLFTHPIVAFETKLQKAESRKRKGVARMLDDCDVGWTSLEFFWRGMGKKKEDCWPCVLIGTEVPQWTGWWGKGGIVEAVENKMGGGWKAEISYRKVVKY